MTDSATITLRDLWVRAVASSPARPFLVFEAPDGSVAEWTYGEFDAEVERVAGLFAQHGVGAARGVHLALTNTPSFVAAWLAAARLGSYIVPSDPMATSNELAEHMSRTNPAVGLCAVTRSAAYREAASDSGLQLEIIDVDETSTRVLPDAR